MLVTRSSFASVVEHLRKEDLLSFDSETFGLRVHHGERAFSFIITDRNTSYYFNFKPYPGLSEEYVLGKSHIKSLDILLSDDTKKWFLHNAKFDMHEAANENLFFAGITHCTQALGRVEYNDHYEYSLAESLFRIGLAKDSTVEEYIKEHKLFTLKDLPWKKEKYKHMHYDLVPFDLIVPYGEKDGYGTRSLGMHQIKKFHEMDKDVTTEKRISNVVDQERRLTKTVFRMERLGCFVDLPYCARALTHEKAQQVFYRKEFKELTGKDFVNSGKLFKEIFKSEEEKWSYTKKGNPSFKSEFITYFDNPAAKTILKLREAKSKENFYSSFAYHADKESVIHPNFNPGGTKHGRFSSSDPNFQNLTSEEDESLEFIVRRAIIPRPGFKLVSIDYKSMEYFFMLENACRILGTKTEIVRLIESGLDVHEATAQVASRAGIPITRAQAKTANFLTLYGGGPAKLALGLKCSLSQAKKIRAAIFEGAPEIERYIDTVRYTAKNKGFITNWLGRRCHFPRGYGAYRAPNYHISGGCADIVKRAMNQVDELLLTMKSKMILSIHDELVFEIHESEEDVISHIVSIMENAFEAKYLPLKVNVSWSKKSLGDLQD